MVSSSSIRCIVKKKEEEEEEDRFAAQVSLPISDRKEQMARFGENMFVLCTRRKTYSRMKTYSGRKNSRGRIPPLPRDIMFSILFTLPAQFLHDKVRFVSQECFDLVVRDSAFILQHLQRSPSGLFLNNVYHPGLSVILEISLGCDVKISRLNFPWFRVVSSCNGLVLFHHRRHKFVFQVGNPITMQVTTLPPRYGYGHLVGSYVMGYAESIRKCKVVTLYDRVCVKPGKPRFTCEIITVGVDRSWRNFNIPSFDHLPRVGCAKLPVSFGGFIYWTSYKFHRVIAMNLDTEVFAAIEFPEVDGRDSGTILEMGGHLCWSPLPKRFSFELWVLDMSSREWSKMLSLDLEDYSHPHVENNLWSPDNFAIVPSAWLKEEELLLCMLCRKPILYRAVKYILCNLKTKEVVELRIDADDHANYFVFFRHVKSLVSPDVC